MDALIVYGFATIGALGLGGLVVGGTIATFVDLRNWWLRRKDKRAGEAVCLNSQDVNRVEDQFHAALEEMDAGRDLE